jgi:uncharacterized protein (DUF1810 family)
MNALDDAHRLQRFVDAQERVFDSVLTELNRGRKYGHWIWFIFPQLKGLGRSSTSEFYGIGSLDEARAYLQHPVLGRRLIQCTELVIAVRGSDAEAIFGEVDAMKFRSCMTLFGAADPEQRLFSQAVEKYFGGEGDPLTLSYLNKQRI